MEVQVPVCVRRFPVDGDVQAAIIPPLEQGVKKGESSVLLHLHSEPDGRSHIVQVDQELFHCALLHDAAGVVYVTLSEAGLHGGSYKCQFLEELHVQVCHHSRDR